MNDNIQFPVLKLKKRHSFLTVNFKVLALKIGGKKIYFGGFILSRY